MIINAYSTRWDAGAPSLGHVISMRRLCAKDSHIPDPEFSDHLRGFMGWAWQTGGSRMTSPLYAVLEHIRHCRSQFSIDITESLATSLTPWAHDANALLFLDDGSLVDPLFRDVIPNEEGVAAGVSPVTREASERMIRVRTALASDHGIRVAESLPPVRSEAEVLVQAPEQVALRTLALALSAEFSFSLHSAHPIDPRDMQQVCPRAFAAMSAQEQRLFADQPMDLATELSWRGEAAQVLLWATGRATLAFPDAAGSFDAVREATFTGSEDEFVEATRLAPVSSILDAQELHRSLLWALRQAEHFGGSPVDADLGVVTERMIAFNWLVDALNTHWDDTDTAT